MTKAKHISIFMFFEKENFIRNFCRNVNILMTPYMKIQRIKRVDGKKGGHVISNFS